VEEHPEHPRCSRRMQIFPPLPPWATPSYRKNKKIQTIEPGTLEATPYETTSEINQPKTSLPIESKITSLQISEFEAVETETLKSL